ncbi:hypothetical protein SAMN05421810_11518 [Amycolatopsis arida]|uniref:Uncharacterized protein n=1 Tax=Amycolatopsis arida TaxID=587909 RepID=A0A1I6AVW9_9PSEU|nr:hypothetical protein [Amycolatopsis arida]TDX85400.1 hypothetical protein CLV69_11559 [Amycolatopsis arida]SFQ72855.1 hypothetical protein SAMN05421810_11518 [Amycolatopsis arida]
MEFEFWAALVAGFTGGLVMSAMMAIMRAAGTTEMNMMYLQGTMFTAKRGAAMAIGAVMHLVVISGAILGSVYALLFTWLNVSAASAWWVGALFGIVHGILGGLMMAGVPAVHPRMGKGDTGGAVALKEPGLFAKNYGSATPAGVLATHVLYGLVLGAVYAWLLGM